MGVVYRAKQIAIQRDVAIKMLRSQVSGQANWVERLRREAQACSLLTHPNTIRLFDYGQTESGEFYMVMELLQGRSLHTLINTEAPISAVRTLRIVMQCCASLSEAHAAGVIHRDIKPENIYVQTLPGNQDFIKLFDFSIAKHSGFALTAVGTILGTPEYMSPEQASGNNVDHRSDIYSLGVVAYVMLKGALLFQSEAPIAILEMHQSQVPPPLPDSVPAPVARLVMSCLEKNPNHRPNSALELLEAAQVWLSELEASAELSVGPSVRNTLKSIGAVSPDAGSQRKNKSIVKTMLGTVGAVTDFDLQQARAAMAKKPVTIVHATGGPTTGAFSDSQASPHPPQATAPAQRSLRPAELEILAAPVDNHAPQGTFQQPPVVVTSLPPGGQTSEMLITNPPPVHPGYNAKAKIATAEESIIMQRGISLFGYVFFALLAISIGSAVYFLLA